MGCRCDVYKTKDEQTTGFSLRALTLDVKWQEENQAHKYPVVVPVSLSIVKAPVDHKVVKWYVCLLVMDDL